jgi:HNH endonuclease
VIRPRKRRGRKGHKVDETASEARNFLDKRSAITPDGKELLYGEDMGKRRREVFVRDCGECEYCGNYSAYDDGEVHHLISRGKGGTDDIDNLVWICKGCHRTRHVRPMFGKAEAARDFDKVPQENTNDS